jgi:putative membrane protein
MGLANLVPGVSGGTMILVTGLYDDFITAVADVTRLKFRRRHVLVLGLIGGAAVVAIAGLAGPLSRAVTLHQSAMFSLFIGFTLGGVPLLLKMLDRVTPGAMIGVVAGLGIMVGVALADSDKPDKSAIREAVAAGTFVITPNYDRDVVAGVLGMSAMVLPGISGAYMLLVLDRYETILAAISVTKSYALSFGRNGDIATAMRVIVPTAVGAVLSLVLFTNLLKWLLHRFPKPSLGVLLGILLGSVIGIWPFGAASAGGDYLLGALLAAAGFVFTAALARFSN